MDFNYSKFYDLAVTMGLKVIYALIVLVIGLKIIKALKKPIKKAFTKSKMDEAVQKFLLSLINALLKVVLITIIASLVGINIASLVAILGAATFAVGLALQGSLSNFAGGVLILLLKPFQIGDFVEVQGHMGTVKEIQIFYTHLLTPDNKLIIIPNGHLSNSSAINYSKMDTRRVDLKFGVGYETDISEVKRTILAVIDKHNQILTDPAPLVRLSDHADSALVYNVRVWCLAADYWSVYYDLRENVKEAFDQSNISIPYPHVDVTMIK